MEEIWKDVVGFEGLYQVSSLGRIKRLERISIYKAGRYNAECHRKISEKIMPQYGWGSKPNIEKAYNIVQLCKDGKQERYYVHTLVAAAFLGPKPERYLITHIDEDGHNNCIDNLAYTPLIEVKKKARDKAKLNRSKNM